MRVRRLRRSSFSLFLVNGAAVVAEIRSELRQQQNVRWNVCRNLTLIAEYKTKLTALLITTSRLQMLPPICSLSTRADVNAPGVDRRYSLYRLRMDCGNWQTRKTTTTVISMTVMRCSVNSRSAVLVDSRYTANTSDENDTHFKNLHALVFWRRFLECLAYGTVPV